MRESERARERPRGGVVALASLPGIDHALGNTHRLPQRGSVLRAAGVSNAFLQRWFDFLAFAFSGLPSEGTVAAAMVYMVSDLYADGAKMDYPVGGSGAVVDALVRRPTLPARATLGAVMLPSAAWDSLGAAAISSLRQFGCYCH